jgi:hypothetical protein
MKVHMSTECGKFHSDVGQQYYSGGLTQGARKVGMVHSPRKPSQCKTYHGEGDLGCKTCWEMEERRVRLKLARVGERENLDKRLGPLRRESTRPMKA